MSVAAHLRIALRHYDRQIPTLIPHYDEMLEAAAGAVDSRATRLVDLGIGSGALSARCLRVARRARLTGIDEDADILRLAARRLGGRITLIHGDFLTTPLPRAETIVASFSLHHVARVAAKQRLYRRISAALVRDGLFIQADCCPAEDPAVAARQHAEWRAHLRTRYSAAQARAFLRAWQREDTYMPLPLELKMMRRARLEPEVVWRRGAFAVLVGRKR